MNKSHMKCEECHREGGKIHKRDGVWRYTCQCGHDTILKYRQKEFSPLDMEDDKFYAEAYNFIEGHMQKNKKPRQKAKWKKFFIVLATLVVVAVVLGGIYLSQSSDEGEATTKSVKYTIYSIATENKFNEIIECINKMAEELSGVETLRTDFIANVSHEMKTPLAVIRNYATLLQAPDLTEAQRMEYARAITDASRRLSDMMTNILKLNRLENQKIYSGAETYELGEQLCECLLQYEGVWESRGIEINTEIEENVFVTADRELLSLVWNNLFSNAFKFTGDGGTVSLSLSADAEHATVTVSDTGCGMTAEVGAHIFEKFYQGDTSRATQGNGLGLALVKRVVDIMQGEISVESAPGVGSTFTVRIRRSRNALEEDR